MSLKVTQANPGKLITKSLFKNYDLCLNPYVGCQFGCRYCYVRFFVKDKELDWGEFVRTRDHIETKLPKELTKLEPNRRLVLGTMTDPYQPQERKSRLTRMALQKIIAAKDKFNKVGIFTRSPIVLDDIDLIKQLPRARVHFTITPYDPEVLKKLEPIAVATERRFETCAKLKEAGIRVHVNVAPALPVLSEDLTEEFAKKLSKAQVDEFFVDPMQAYGESLDATKEAMQTDARWPQIEKIITDKDAYLDWKSEYRKQWYEAWKQHGNPKTFAIWMDHVTKAMENMATGEELDHRYYADDIDLAPEA